MIPDDRQSRTDEDELAIARLGLANRLRGLANRAYHMDASAIVCFHTHLDNARDERRAAEGRAQ